MSKILSVVIPAYNCEKTLEKSVNSVLNQPCANDIEIILVDDGSKDETPRLCDKLKEKHKDSIIVFHDKNSGSASAKNRGIDLATGKYLAILDSDDWWEKDIFDESIKNKLEHEDIDIYSFSMNYVSHDLKHQKTRKPSLDEKEMIGFGKLITPLIMHQSSFYKLALINHNNIRYPFIYAMEDYYFVTMAFSVAQSYRCVDKTLYNYYINMNSFFHIIKPEVLFKAQIEGMHLVNEWADKYSLNIKFSKELILALIVGYLPKHCGDHSFKETISFFKAPIFSVLDDKSVKPWQSIKDKYNSWHSNKKKFWIKSKIKEFIPCKLKESRTKPPFLKAKNYIWYRFIKKLY